MLEINLNQWLPIFLILFLTMIVIFLMKKYEYVPQWFTNAVVALRRIFSTMKVRKNMDDDTLDEIIKTAGYAYDEKQDIFYSSMDAWQRDMGYWRLYDEAAAPLSMIIDCEPIYFEYDDKRWMIEFWKGQYGMTTGGEIGIYTTEESKISTEGVFNGTFYKCASNEDLLDMSFSLKKKGKTLFTRKDRHWWLTGFKLGEFSEPSDLTMNLWITFKNSTMRDAFVTGLKNAGYSKNEMIIYRNTVKLKFDKTRTPQPLTRTKQTDAITQRKNKLLCDRYQAMTREYDNSLDKIKAIHDEAPDMFKNLINIGKTKELYSKYKNIKS